MSIERGRSWTGSSPEVTKRLYAIIVFLIGVMCVFGGFMLGRMSRQQLKPSNDVVSLNLTVSAENLYKKAAQMSPKTVFHNDPEKLTAKLLDIFHCNQTDCGTINKINLAGFVKKCINNEVNKLIKSIYNATVYLDSLR